MKPTEILSDEHRVIEQVLACLDRMIDVAKRKGIFDEQRARDVVDFFRNFADACHHGKEEVHLFTLLEARGFQRATGPTGVMLAEHELGREHVKGMIEAIPAAARGEKAALESFIGHARAYIDLLGDHIHKEDHCLFPMAEHALGVEDRKALLAAFERVETHEMGTGTHEKYLKLAHELADHYGVPKVAAGKSAGAGCGCRH